MRPTSEQEWYVVAAIFTAHVLMAAAFLLLWAVMFVALFLVIAWMASLA